MDGSGAKKRARLSVPRPGTAKHPSENTDKSRAHGGRGLSASLSDFVLAVLDEGDCCKTAKELSCYFCLRDHTPIGLTKSVSLGFKTTSSPWIVKLALPIEVKATDIGSDTRDSAPAAHPP